ncbi:MAG: type II secretion system GspH family protein [Heliobacteriaceae bacterium]|jgi:prepilin-type N-terminal cleavage/methylation domain-containing protein|nr:type II secretion system GspH family protein [Heliobacteriaceae bacterium]
MKKHAFTLAEVLITLGIIGVAAALTLPVLIQKQNDAARIAALKKAYSVLSQALQRAVADNGEYQNWDNTLNTWQKSKGWYSNYLKPYLKVIKECDNTTGCWAKGYTKTLSGGTAGTDSVGTGLANFNFVLADGMYINMDSYANTVAYSRFGVNTNLDRTLGIFADVNGDKGPNQIGRDIFAFVFNEKGLIPAGTDNDSANCITITNGTGYDCTAKVLSEGRIDY